MVAFDGNGRLLVVFLYRTPVLSRRSMAIQCLPEALITRREWAWVDGEASATREKTRSIGHELCRVPETTMFLTEPFKFHPRNQDEGQKRCTPENPRKSRVFFFFRRFSRFFKNQKPMREKGCKTRFRGVGGDLNLRLPFLDVFSKPFFAELQIVFFSI